MQGCHGKSKIQCRIRCLEPEAVQKAKEALGAAGVVHVPYVCKLSGQPETVWLISDDVAAMLSEQVAAIKDVMAAKILAALASAELCECDIATLIEGPENEVVAQLQRLHAAGLITHRVLQSMNYYRLTESKLPERIPAMLKKIAQRYSS